MVSYQFEIDDETWTAWKRTVPRTKPLDQRLRELIEADTDGRVLEADAATATAPTTEPEPEPRARRETTVTRAPDTDDGTVVASDDRAEPVSDGVHAAVDHVAASWDDDDRLEDRKAAARAVLEYAVTTDEHVSKSVAVDRFHAEYAVADQSIDTWWRQTVRPVLQAVGEHSRGRGYRVDRDQLAAVANGDDRDE